MAETDIPDFQPMSPPIATVPPTVRPDFKGGPTTTWPMVVGVICIVLGVLGALGGVCGIVGTVGQSAMMGMMEEEEESPAMIEAMTRYQPYTIAVQGVSMIVSIVLAIGGFGLVSRKPWSRTVLLHWSWIRMIVALFAIAIGYLSQQAMMEAVAADPDAQMPAQFGMMMGAFGFVFLVLGLIWSWALPIFCLVWFNRERIRTEVSEWA